jgi:protein-tyrosine phosphatase
MFRKIRSMGIVAMVQTRKLVDLIIRKMRRAPALGSYITVDLLLGSEHDNLQIKQLRSCGVTAIINVRQTSILPSSRTSGLRYLHIPLEGNAPPALDDLVQWVDFMDDEIRSRSGKVYIYCRQGVRRGPGLAMAYLLKRGITYEDAMSLLKRICINVHLLPSQIERLKELEYYYQGKP